MTWRPDPAVVEWLSSEGNPPVRYLTARDPWKPQPSASTLAALRERISSWEPLEQVLALQHRDGDFAAKGSPSDARRTFWALLLMQRCGLDSSDEPVTRAIEHLNQRHRCAGAVSYTTGGSGVLPCYLGVVAAALIKMGALDTDIVQSSIRWLVEHQRFDHKTTRAGGDEPWSYKAPKTYGCWESVSCFHGVAGAFRALAAIPPERRGADVRPVVIHPEFWTHRRLAIPGAERFELPTTSRRALEDTGFQIIENRQPSFLFDRSVLITGEVDRTTAFEKGFAIHEARRNGGWEPDPLILDDQALIANVHGKGLVVLTGCGHAGVINICHYAQRLTGVDRIHAVIGGFHLNGPLFEPLIGPTIHAFEELAPDVVVPTHCTGWKAIHAIARRLPDAFIQNSVGTTFELMGSTP